MTRTLLLTNEHIEVLDDAITEYVHHHFMDDKIFKGISILDFCDHYKEEKGQHLAISYFYEERKQYI